MSERVAQLSPTSSSSPAEVVERLDTRDLSTGAGMESRPGALGSPRSPTFPVVLLVSLLAHGLLFSVLSFLPEPSSALALGPTEVTIEVASLPEPLVEPEPVIEPEPVAEPEPVVEPAPPRRVRAAPPQSPPPAASPPPPPPPTLVAAGAGDFQMPAGQEGGEIGGTVGGTVGGTGEGNALSEARQPQEPAPPAARGMSRAALRRALSAYIRGTLSRFINGRIVYPLAARRAHAQGVVLLRVRLDQRGSLLSVRLSRTSGSELLDEAALASIRSIGDLPAPPSEIPWDNGQELPLPVRYVLR